VSGRALAAAALGVALVVMRPSAGATQDRPGARTRVELLRFAEVLELAAGKVSRPSPFQLMGPATGASSYLLPGYGAIFVLSARALPVEGGVIVMHEGPPGSQPVIEFWRRDGRRLQKPRDGRVRVEINGPPDLQALDRDIQQIESLVQAYSREAELASREAEKAFERVEREIRGRFPEEVPPVPPAAPAPPAAAPATAPTNTAAPPAAAQPQMAPPAQAARPPAPAQPAVAPQPPPPAPPWRFWFQADDEGDPRPPEQVISEVKNALIQALEARSSLLTIVGPEDYVVVAVDFTARGFPLRPERRAERTLIVKAKKRDLDERRAGRIVADELRKRIETVEY
jgi:hypothetical protein